MSLTTKFQLEPWHDNPLQRKTSRQKIPTAWIKLLTIIQPHGESFYWRSSQLWNAFSEHSGKYVSWVLRHHSSSSSLRYAQDEIALLCVLAVGGSMGSGSWPYESPRDDLLASVGGFPWCHHQMTASEETKFWPSYWRHFPNDNTINTVIQHDHKRLAKVR